MRQIKISAEQIFNLLAYFPYFEKIKGGLRDHLSVCVSVIAAIGADFRQHLS
jgi:hypothetical protein